MATARTARGAIRIKTLTGIAHRAHIDVGNTLRRNTHTRKAAAKRSAHIDVALVDQACLAERIEKLLAMQQKAEAQKRKAEQQLKAAKHKISIQRNKERTHRLCERGGHLEHYLPNPELLTDEDVFLLIDYFFSSPRVHELAEQMTASRRGGDSAKPEGADRRGCAAYAGTIRVKRDMRWKRRSIEKN